MTKQLIIKCVICVLIVFTLAMQVNAQNESLTDTQSNITNNIENTVSSEEITKDEMLNLKESNTTEKEALSSKTSNEISFNIHIENSNNLIPQNMVFGIYSPNSQFWGAQRIWVSDIGADHTIRFEVPEYVLGETLYLKLFSGAEKIQYGYDFYGIEEMIPIETFVYYSEDEDKLIYGNDFSISATPVTGRKVTGYANGWELYFKNPAKIIDGVCMIPMYEYLEAMFMTDCAVLDETNGRIEINANEHTIVFFLNGNDMYLDGNVTYSNVVPQKINGVIYIPFRFLVEGLGGNISVQDTDGVMKIYANLIYTEETVGEEFVNKQGIKSKTDYLVWVSKANHTVTVFLDRSGVWDEIKVFPCSIGAPSTPTITGQYEYFSKESRWSYQNYYVGPIMRFYRGYALHSTLLRYDGTDYDARVGENISLGCIRLEPENINWMVDMVPLQTKIYITEQ